MNCKDSVWENVRLVASPGLRSISEGREKKKKSDFDLV